MTDCIQKTVLLGIFVLCALGPAAARADVAPFQKVFVIFLENENETNALDQPYLAELASRGALLTNFHAETHPSQGNYFAFTAGDILGQTFFWADWTVTKNVSNVADLLEAKKLTWKSYAEDYPGDCFTGADFGKYARKHNPFISFKSIQKNPARCGNIVNSRELDNDIADGKLPDFSFYAPNLDNDGHDTGVAYASRWLHDAFDGRLADPRFTKDLLFVVTFDESQTFTPKNPIYTVLYGPSVTPGAKSDARYDHYSVLRTIEDAFGLETLGRHDAKAAAITGIWNR